MISVVMCCCFRSVMWDDALFSDVLADVWSDVPLSDMCGDALLMIYGPMSQMSCCLMYGVISCYLMCEVMSWYMF